MVWWVVGLLWGNDHSWSLEGLMEEPPCFEGVPLDLDHGLLAHAAGVEVMI